MVKRIYNLGVNYIHHMWPIGLTVNEEKIAQFLLDNGSNDAQTIARLTGMQRRVVYDVLAKLGQIGIVSQSMLNNKTYFSLALEGYLVQSQEKQKEVEKHLQSLIDQSKSVKLQSSTQVKAQLFYGVQAVKQVLLAQVSSKEDYITLGGTDKAVEILGEHFWQNYNVRQAEQKNKGKIIFNRSLSGWAKQIQHPFIKVKFLDEGIEPLTQTFVYGNKMLLLIWSDSPVATIIEDEKVADSYRMFFELLWKNASVN